MSTSKKSTNVCLLSSRSAKIMTLESGKPLRESVGEVGYGTSFIDYYAAEAIRTTSAGGGILVPSPFSSVDGSPRFVSCFPSCSMIYVLGQSSLI
jgi:hypothetical protein